MPSFRLSAGRVGVQPAAEPRHVQRHNHVRHVPSALLPVPCHQSAVAPSLARCLPPRSSTACCPRPAHFASLRMPFFRLSAERVGVQPVAELRHVQRHEHAIHVLRAFLATRALLPICSRALPCTLDAPRSSTACCPPTRIPRPAPQPRALPPICSRALPCTLRAPRSSTACCPLTRTPRSAPHALLLTLGRAHRRSTSR